jgi:ABC-type multidrug transport system ATPase subunit
VQLLRIVGFVTHALQLGPVANSVVGNVDKRGISGGQRKRVNIGYELVAAPALLFADEPTSGGNPEQA